MGMKMIGGGYAPTPGVNPRDFQADVIAGLLTAFADPKAAAKLLEGFKSAATNADKRATEARKAVEELNAARQKHDERERALKVREDNADKVEQEHRLRRQELRDLSDAAVNDRNRASKELSDARASAKEIITEADTHALNAEAKAKGALQHHLTLTKEIAQLEKTRDGLKAELRAMAARITG
jgi:hypothetical protein